MRIRSETKIAFALLGGLATFETLSRLPSEHEVFARACTT
jgi:hypothetical protein